MVQLALSPLIADTIGSGEGRDGNGGRSAGELLAIRVCDPAIGEGAFLAEVIEELAMAVAAAWTREGEPPARTWTSAR